MTSNNMSSQDYFKVSGSLFAFVAFMHVLRLWNHWIFAFGKWMFPFWVSWVAVIVAGYLSYQAFVLAGVIKPR